MNWWTYEPTRPIRADGIKARSTRGAIGEQWWSQRFISVLESYGNSGRLTRGRSYARAGQVLRLNIGKGTVNAQVQGSRSKPYRVDVRIKQLPTPQWRQVEDTLAAQALFRAKLLAGEMPPEIEDVFADAGASLFPRSWGDFVLLCSCPDGTVPCKHLAATFYLLAEAFDADPFLVLKLRGRDREELLDRLRAQGGTPDDAETSGPAIAVDEPPLADCLDAFWQPALTPARLRERAARPHAVRDLLLRSLDPPPVKIRDRSLLSALAPAYGAAPDELESIATRPALEAPPPKPESSEPEASEPGPSGPEVPTETDGETTYRFKITLDGVRPRVWRRFDVPGSFTLCELHETVQDVMGWENTHLYYFDIDARYGPEADAELGMTDGDEMRVEEVLDTGSRFTYFYDFGDRWTHDIVVEKVLTSRPGARPRCRAGARACPPEDCGGPSGYAGLLAVRSDPNHPEHDATVEWLGDDFDPAAFSVAEVNEDLDAVWLDLPDTR